MDPQLWFVVASMDLRIVVIRSLSLSTVLSVSRFGSA